MPSLQQVAPKYKVGLAYITGWVWLIGNWTITLSGTCRTQQSGNLGRLMLKRVVNFGFASLLSATVSMYHGDYTMSPWQLLLVFYAICLVNDIDMNARPSKVERGDDADEIPVHLRHLHLL